MLYTQLAMLYLEYHHQLWVPQQKSIYLLEWVLRKAAKILKELEVLSYEDKPSKQKLFSCEKRKTWEGGGGISKWISPPPPDGREQRWWKHTLLSAIQWQAKRQWRKKKLIREVPIEPKNCKNGQRLEQAALRGWKFYFLEDTENTAGQGSEQLALVDFILSTWQPPTILWSSPFAYKTK